MRGGVGVDTKKEIKREKGMEKKEEKTVEQKQQGLAVNKQSPIQQDFTNQDMSKGMPKFARGPEVELACISDVEELKHILAQNNVHVDYDVLQRAIVLPKDMDNAQAVYPSVSNMLQKAPEGSSRKSKKKKKKK